nr:MAG TPA: hypothetical protein [Caudoviricetes sp.]
MLFASDIYRLELSTLLRVLTWGYPRTQISIIEEVYYNYDN